MDWALRPQSAKCATKAQGVSLEAGIGVWFDWDRLGAKEQKMFLPRGVSTLYGRS